MPVRPATGLLSGFSGFFPFLPLLAIPCQKWIDKHRKSKSQPTLCQILLKNRLYDTQIITTPLFMPTPPLAVCHQELSVSNELMNNRNLILGSCVEIFDYRQGRTGSPSLLEKRDRETVAQLLSLHWSRLGLSYA